MRLNKRKMKQRREERREEDRQMRRNAITFNGTHLLHKGFWWYVMKENNRGLLRPVERFATRSLACRFIDAR